MPAHEPRAGSPERIAARIGSKRSKARSSLSMVVDSPPGMTIPSRRSSSAGTAHRNPASTDGRQRGKVLPDVPLEGQHPDRGRVRSHNRRVYGCPSLSP